MPSVDAHLRAAETHVAAYESMTDGFAGWKAVMLFYAAVHYVEAVFACSDTHFSLHCDRENELMKKHRAIWAQYLRLRNESEKARYLAPRHLAHAPDQEWRKLSFALTDNDVKVALYEKRLKAIIDYCMPIIKVYQQKTAAKVKAT